MVTTNKMLVHQDVNLRNTKQTLLYFDDLSIKPTHKQLSSTCPTESVSLCTIWNDVLQLMSWWNSETFHTFSDQLILWIVYDVIFMILCLIDCQDIMLWEIHLQGHCPYKYCLSLYLITPGTCQVYLKKFLSTNISFWHLQWIQFQF